MKVRIGIAILIGLIFMSCAYTPIPKVDYNYPHIGSSINASLAVKDYQTLGLIFVKSSEVIDGNGNHTGSKITYEMLLLEAQKLRADDIINIRIDINHVEDFDIDGKIIKTTYNYTATALAIRYTTAVVAQNSTDSNQNIGNANIVVNKMESSSPDRVINNWISAGASMAGGGLRYERLLFPKFTMGIDSYYQWFDVSSRNAWGVCATARFYPFEKILYVGAGLGVHGYEKRNEYWVDNPYHADGGYYYNEDSYDTIGFGISPEIGCKFDFGAPGGFTVDLAVKVPQVLGGEKGYNLSVVPYIGLGWAF